MVIPVGKPEAQQLMVIVRGETGYTEQTLAEVSFVPLLAGKS